MNTSRFRWDIWKDAQKYCSFQYCTWSNMFNLSIRTEINGRFRLLFCSLSLQLILMILTTTDPSLFALSSASYYMERHMYGTVSQHLADRKLISAMGFTPGKQCLKYGGITAHLGSDKIHLGSDKTGFHSLQSEETDIVTLKLNWECAFNCGLSGQNHWTGGPPPNTHTHTHTHTFTIGQC